MIGEKGITMEVVVPGKDTLITSSDVSMPRIIYGTAWKKERTEALVIEAVIMGFRGIDTACQPKHYHEAGVGMALQRLAGTGDKTRKPLSSDQVHASQWTRSQEDTL